MSNETGRARPVSLLISQRYIHTQIGCTVYNHLPKQLRKEVKGMPGKKHRAPKKGPIWHRSAEEATLDRMPKYNAYACGTGAHGDAKYKRCKQKRAFERELQKEREPQMWLPFTQSCC